MITSDVDSSTGEKSSHPTGRLRKVLLALGVLAALTWISADLYASFRYEGYRWPADAISGLSAVDSPVQSMSRAGTLLYDLLRIGFAGLLPMIWFFLSNGAGAHAGGKRFRFFSYSIIVAMLILGTLPLLGNLEVGVDQPPALFGASERINTCGYMLWMMALAVVLLRNPASIRGSEEMTAVAGAMSAVHRV